MNRNDTGFLILDYGSQYTMLIARKLRELGYYSMIVPSTTRTLPEHFSPYGAILSGGPDSTNQVGARDLPTWVLELNVPVLGVCYGLQLLIKHFGGKIHSTDSREYGSAEIFQENTSAIWANVPTTTTAWMSHGDHCEADSEVWKIIAQSQTDEKSVLAAVEHQTLPVYGLQFHPEVHHSQHGNTLLDNFAAKVCNADKNWQDSDRLSSTQNYIKETVGGEGNILMAVSGGVDSTVAVTLLVKTLGKDRIHAVMVDHGLLRYKEVEWVKDQFQRAGVENFTVIDAKKKFLNQLAGVSDPESKRKIIGRLFVEEFENYSNNLNDISFLGQGTLYPDVIESAGDGDGAKVIKSHHNVGGLPEKMGFKLIEPFRYLFKDEVREIGRSLGLPSELIDRHPFPGPGLGIRILGTIDQEKIAIVQKADHIFIEALKKANLYQKVWQAYAALLPVRSVGVMGDERTYEWMICLRAVDGVDAMTARPSNLPHDFIASVAARIVAEVKGVNRVVYDYTSKPPATIEME